MRILRTTGLTLCAAGAMLTLGKVGSGLASAPAIAPPGAARDPVVVELFQSQGCSSCPPANAYLNSIADRPDILALSFAVTYWDRLGWKDTFGSPRFTARQQDYAGAGRGEVATPELIVNGSNAVVGADSHAFGAAIADATAPRGGPGISVEGSMLRLGAAPASAPATVWLVRYDPRVRNVPIRAGENSGRTLPHRGIVRELVNLGAWSGRPASYALPPAHEPSLAVAVLLQRGNGGPIIGARKL